MPEVAAFTEATFHASPRIRRSQVTSVAIYSFMLFLTLAVGLFILLDLAWDVWALERPRLFWLIIGAPLLISALLAWLWGRRRFVFFVGLTDNCIHIGERAPLRILYDQIEMITLEVNPGEALFGGESDSMIEFRGKGFATHACIDPEDRYKCAAILAAKCPNALFVDELGQDYMAQHVTDRTRVFSRSVRFHHQRAWRNLFVTTALAGYLAIRFADRLFSKESELSIMDFVLLFMLPLGIYATIHEFRSATKLRLQIEDARLNKET